MRPIIPDYGDASLNGIPFRINPRSVRWSYTIKSAETHTLGGKVIQIFGSSVDDMTVTGTFGRGFWNGQRMVHGWEAQQQFLQQMVELAESQIEGPYESPSLAIPRFSFPSKGWDFRVRLMSYTDGSGSTAINDTPQAIAPNWELTFSIVIDNTASLARVAQDIFIARIAEGIGWVPNEYNGPMTYTDVEEALQGRTIETHLNEGFVTGPTGEAGTIADDPIAFSANLADDGDEDPADDEEEPSSTRSSYNAAPSASVLWGADTPVAMPQGARERVWVDFGGFGFTENGVVHNLTEDEAEAIHSPRYAPPPRLTAGRR